MFGQEKNTLSSPKTLNEAIAIGIFGARGPAVIQSVRTPLVTFITDQFVEAIRHNPDHADVLQNIHEKIVGEL